MTVTFSRPGRCRPVSIALLRSPSFAAHLAAGILLALTLPHVSLAHAGPAQAPSHENAQQVDHDHEHDHGSGQPDRAVHDHGSGNPGGGSSPHEQEEREHTHGEAGASHASHDGGERGSASARAVSDVWTSGENPLPLDDATLARGKQVYQRFCSACHGPTGLGDGQAHAAAIFDPGPANLALHGPSHSAGEYARIVHEGNDASAMPRFAKKLSEEEIWSVVHYIRHGLADDIEDRHDQKHEH